jgi:hypothetical protein
LLCDKYPTLFSFALDEDASFSKIYNSDDLFSQFILPLSVEAFQDLQLVSQQTAENPMEISAIDRRIFVWGTNYVPARFYKFLFAQLSVDGAFAAIWKS